MTNHPTDAEIIAYNLRRLLSARGYSQLDFSKLIGERRTTVNTWCKGKAVPRFPKFAKMAAVLGCSVSDITELKDPSAISLNNEYMRRLSLLPEEDQKTIYKMIDFYYQTKVKEGN